MILLPILSAIRHLSVATTRIVFWTWTWSKRNCAPGQEGCWFQCWENSYWIHLTSPITLVLLMWKWMDLFLRKNHLLKCWGCLSLLNWIAIAKTASKKIGALIRSMNFLSSVVALHLYKSTLWPCMEYCCHVWAGAVSCYFELLNYKNGYVGLLVFYLRPLLNPCVIVKM